MEFLSDKKLLCAEEALFATLHLEHVPESYKRAVLKTMHQKPITPGGKIRGISFFMTEFFTVTAMKQADKAFKASDGRVDTFRMSTVGLYVSIISNSAYLSLNTHFKRR